MLIDVSQTLVLQSAGITKRLCEKVCLSMRAAKRNRHISLAHTRSLLFYIKVMQKRFNILPEYQVCQVKPLHLKGTKELPPLCISGEDVTYFLDRFAKKEFRMMYVSRRKWDVLSKGELDWSESFLKHS